MIDEIIEFFKPGVANSLSRHVTRINGQSSKIYTFNSSVFGHDIIVHKILYRNVQSIYASNEGFWYLCVNFVGHTYDSGQALKDHEYEYASETLSDIFLNEQKYIGESPQRFKTKRIKWKWDNGYVDKDSIPDDLVFKTAALIK